MKKAMLFVLIVGMLAMGTRPKMHVIAMAKFKFEPAVIRVHAGDMIVWDNQDVVPHTARTPGGFDTGDIPAKSKRRIVVRKRGEFNFDCAYHSNMKGKLVVQ